MSSYVLDFEGIDRTMTALVGGKAANLGELWRLDGVAVPDGFCVTTEAFRRVLAAASVEDHLARLSGLVPDDREAIASLSAEVREAIETVGVPDDLAAAIVGSLGRLGEESACAVRSSATAEDLPGASFAGQQDSYLDVRGPAAVLEHVSRCWASLFTERAVAYRLRGGFDQRQVGMAVIVQRMVPARAAGVLFTADPITSNRKVSSVEAVRGLGEELVSGRAAADSFKVRDEQVTDRAVTASQPVLTDSEVLCLARLGRRIEAHFGRPQDIEWCLADEEFQIVQSRPITTLFPIPAAEDDGNRVYVSVGHQQMMTDAMKPLGISMWQLNTKRRMAEAGGRLFVDVTRALATPKGRAGNLKLLGDGDPLIGDALRTVHERGFVPELPDDEPEEAPLADLPPVETDPAIVDELIERNQAAVAALKREIATKSGPDLLDFIRGNIRNEKKVLFRRESLQVIMAGMRATWWLNERMEAWLGEKNAADALAQSAPNNVTAEMGLALLDVADAIRPHPEVVAYLQRLENEGAAAEAGGEDYLDELPALPGGREARDAIEGFLATYGMRCVGEIDITRPRWSERPLTLVPMILGNVRNFGPGEGAERFERGRRESERKERELLAALRALPDGEEKAAETERMIAQLRAFTGYREYPKYGMVSRDFVYKQALMREAERLARDGVIDEPEDIFHLRFEELEEVVRRDRADRELIRRRKEEFRSFEALTPPRVLTSEGEAIVGTYRRDGIPAGALVGMPVSAGTVEGRARVVLDIAAADLEAGDILVTPFTDPSWTPLFVAIGGLVTEVGGQMTHGAVIAREYGLPAVVGLERATELIEDGRRIRLHGTDGYVELLE